MCGKRGEGTKQLGKGGGGRVKESRERGRGAREEGGGERGGEAEAMWLDMTPCWVCQLAAHRVVHEHSQSRRGGWNLARTTPPDSPGPRASHSGMLVSPGTAGQQGSPFGQEGVRDSPETPQDKAVPRHWAAFGPSILQHLDTPSLDTPSTMLEMCG